MNDLQKIREAWEKDNGDWDAWPYPTVTIESIVSGELRARILQVLHIDENSDVRLIETKVSGGYSEFTAENECEIEVRIDGSAVWKYEDSTTESAMSAFLTKFG